MREELLQPSGVFEGRRYVDPRSPLLLERTHTGRSLAANWKFSAWWRKGWAQGNTASLKYR